MGKLVYHAHRELSLAGLGDEDADYGGMLEKAVLELIETFDNQGHSGASAAITIHLFHELVNWRTLSPLTDDPDEWQSVSEVTGEEMWQSKRRPDAFSTDGGKTHYLLSEMPTDFRLLRMRMRKFFTGKSVKTHRSFVS